MHVPPEWRDYHASNIELILNGTESAGNAGMRVRLYDEERVVLALWRAVMSGEISAVEFIEIYSNAGDAVQAAGAAFAQKRARSNAIAIALSALPAFRLFPQSAVVSNPIAVLRPGGRLVGTPGSSSYIRKLQGGVAEAQAFFNKLGQGAVVVRTTTRNGGVLMIAKLPGGGVIRFRPVSTSGPATVDVSIKGIGIREIKFVESP